MKLRSEEELEILKKGTVPTNSQIPNCRFKMMMKVTLTTLLVILAQITLTYCEKQPKTTHSAIWSIKSQKR